MKVLFVCYANAGRSQMAKAFYNAYSESSNADSAGIAVHKKPAANLEQFEEIYGDAISARYGAENTLSVLEAMAQKDVDVSEYERTQFAPEMIERYDLVVSILEKSQTPNWFRGKNVIWWNVLDPLGERSKMLAARDEIELRVKRLIELEKSGGDFHELDDKIDKENK